MGCNKEMYGCESERWSCVVVTLDESKIWTGQQSTLIPLRLFGCVWVFYLLSVCLIYTTPTQHHHDILIPLPPLLKKMSNTQTVHPFIPERIVRFSFSFPEVHRFFLFFPLSILTFSIVFLVVSY
jgi:hypothetical protein